MDFCSTYLGEGGVSMQLGWKVLWGICRNEVSSHVVTCCWPLACPDCLLQGCGVCLMQKQPVLFAVANPKFWSLFCLPPQLEKNINTSILWSWGTSQYFHYVCKPWKLFLLECFPLLGNIFPFFLSSSSLVAVLQENCVLVHLHVAVQGVGPYMSLGRTDKSVFKDMAIGHPCAGDAWDSPVLCHYTWLLSTTPGLSTADVNVVRGNF